MLKLLEIGEEIYSGVVVRRINRFVVEIDFKGKPIRCHLTDTGRLPKLLVENNGILFVKRFKKRNRLTDCEVLALKDLESGDWILTNTRLHPKIVQSIISRKLIKPLDEFRILKREYKFGSSRIDFLLENFSGEKALLEVKGCTLFDGDVGYYPDAPTERGRRHLNELIKALKYGYKSYVMFIVPKRVKIVKPNKDIDPIFAKKAAEAIKKGVIFFGVSIKLMDNNIYFLEKVGFETD